MQSHPRAPRSFLTGLITASFTFGAGLFAPTVALADPPAPLPSAAPAPPAAPAQPPAAEPVSEAAQQAASSKPLPASVLAMQGHDVVLRLDFDAHLEGRLITANDDVFVVRKPTGETVSIPRKSVRGLRLSETAAPALAPIARPQYSGGGRSYPGADSDGLDPVFRPRERSVGFGTAFGGGATSAGQGLSGALLLPTAELQIFLPGEYSIDLSMPVLNMALGSALIGGTLVGADIYFNVNAGKERTRLVAGPGIGFGYVSAQGQSAFSLKIPAQLGFEVLSKKRSFGFKMLARPWLELASGTYSSTFGGGVMAALVFSGYALSDRDSE